MCSHPARPGFLKQLDKDTGIDSGRTRGWEEGARSSNQPGSGPGPGPGPVLRAGQPHLGWKSRSCSSYSFMRDFGPERGFHQPKFRYYSCLGVGMGPACRDQLGAGSTLILEPGIIRYVTLPSQV